MKRVLTLFIIVALASTAVYAQDVEKDYDFSVTVGPEFLASLGPCLAGASAQFVWQPNTFGLSAGLHADVGLAAPDVYLIPTLGLRVGWFALEGGAVLPAYDAALPGYIETSIDTVEPFARLGAAIPLGPIGIDAGARLMFTDIYVEDSGDGSDIGEGIAAAFLAIFGSIKLDLGVCYRMPF